MRGRFWIAMMTASFGLGVVTGWVLGFVGRKEVPTASAVPVTINTPTPEREIMVGWETETVSKSGKYKLRVYKPDSQSENNIQECRIEILSRDGDAIDVKGWAQTKIGCQYGMGFHSEFIRWGDNDNILFGSFDGETRRVVSMPEKISRTVNFAGKYTLLDVDDGFGKWLVVKEDGEGVEYLVVDSDGSHLRSGMKYSRPQDGANAAFYDDKNKGFVIVTERIDRLATDKAVEKGENVGNGLFVTRVDFLKLKDYEFRTLLITDPTPLFGRGCGGGGLKSRPGYVVIDDGCLLFDGKYQNSFGQVELKI